MHVSSLSRTSSAASISSDDAARRTRKRFSSMQLMMLEQLFHETSHPTREERETVARAAGMEVKSVTIWFQNKRQTERKVALHHASAQSADASSSPSVSAAQPSSPIYTSMPTTLSSTTHPFAAHARPRSLTPRRRLTPPHSRPSLDRIAARSESRLPPPRTPTKPRDPHAALWDNMPSSPLAPPASPPARDLVEFMGTGRTRTTLEWACAAARLAGKEGRQSKRRVRPREHGHEREPELLSSALYHVRHDRRGSGGDVDADVDGRLVMSLAGGGGGSGGGGGGGEEDTEEDDIEAVTPEGSLGVSDAARWHSGAHTAVRTRPGLLPLPGFSPPFSVMQGRSSVEVPAGRGAPGKDDVPQDEDMMRAALALCGLGRTRG